MNYDFDDFDEETILDFVNSLPKEQKEQLQELLNVLVYELFSTTNREKDVVFCGSNGTNVIKCLNASRSSLGEDGPILLPSSNPTVILFAVATEYLQETVDSYKNLYPDPELCEVEWQKFFDSLANQATQLADSSEPAVWEQLLDV
jgi:hypothetical protein|tara:strand:+ start:193 stop:630 length:438 start_codon:yes stop_codon:yes gene_type:complete